MSKNKASILAKMLEPPIRNKHSLSTSPVTINILSLISPLNVDGSARRANIGRGHGGRGAGAQRDMARMVGTKFYLICEAIYSNLSELPGSAQPWAVVALSFSSIGR